MPDAGTRRERIRYLDKQKLINCGRCPPNRGENQAGRRKRVPWARKVEHWKGWDPFSHHNRTRPKRLR